MGSSSFHEPLGQKSPVWGRDTGQRKHFSTQKDYQLNPEKLSLRRASKKDSGAGLASPLRHKKRLRFCDRTGPQNLTLSFLLDTEAWKFPTLRERLAQTAHSPQLRAHRSSILHARTQVTESESQMLSVHTAQDPKNLSPGPSPATLPDAPLHVLSQSCQI